MCWAIGVLVVLFILDVLIVVIINMRSSQISAEQEFRKKGDQE